MVSFWGWGMDQKLFVGSTYVVEQLLFAMFFSIMIFFFLLFQVSKLFDFCFKFTLYIRFQNNLNIFEAYSIIITSKRKLDIITRESPAAHL